MRIDACRNLQQVPYVRVQLSTNDIIVRGIGMPHYTCDFSQTWLGDHIIMLYTHHVNSSNVEALDPETQAKYEHLQAILCDMESVLVAYSGGVDSALLLKVAHDVLGTRAIGAIAASPAYATEE